MEPSRQPAMSGSSRRSQLAAAVRQCSERGLRQSSRWAAEQLVGMSRDSPAGNADEHAMVVDDEPAVPSEEEEHTALLAKAYFDLNEFQRAAHALRGARHPRSRFLRWYALFLAGEKHKDEEAVEDSTRDSLSVPSGKPRVVNKQLAQLQSELQPASDEGVLDGFGHYVHALVLRELQRKAEAVSALVRAVAIYPLLWAAWTEIAALVTEPEALSALSLPSHWMRSFFDAHAALEAQQNKQARARPRLTEPAEAVPRSLLASPLRPPPGARGHRRSHSTRSCSAHSRARRSSSASSPSRSTTSASLMRHSTPSNSYCTTTRAG